MTTTTQIDSMDPFDIVFERMFTHEGGYQNHPGDRGNWTSGRVGVGELKGTKYGISAMTYPHLEIIDLSYAEAKEIYKREWWDTLGMQRFPEALRFQLFDAAINHGMYNTTKILQRAVGVAPDAIIGPKTLAAVNGAGVSDLLINFLAERLQFMTQISTWNRFGKGWARRIAANLRYAAKDNQEGNNG